MKNIVLLGLILSFSCVLQAQQIVESDKIGFNENLLRTDFRYEIGFKEHNITLTSSYLPTEIIGGYYDAEKCFVIFKRGLYGVYFSGAEFIDGNWQQDYRDIRLNLMTSVYVTMISDVEIHDGNSFSYTATYSSLHPKAPGKDRFVVRITSRGLFFADTGNMIDYRKGGEKSKRVKN